MNQYDCETLEQLSSKYKIRYDNMDVTFGEKIGGTNAYIAINITNLLLDFEAFKNSLVDVSDFEMHAAVAILNLFAHYRHFFKIKDVNHVVVIGFVKDNYAYDKNTKILEQVVDYCNFFPNVYMIPRVIHNKRMYIHVVCAALCHMKNVMPSTNESSLFVVSNSSIDRQIVCLFPTRCAYILMKTYGNKPALIEKTSYMRALFGGKDVFYDGSPYKAQLECMNVLIGRYFGYSFRTTMKRLNRNGDVRTKYLHHKGSEKMSIITSFLGSNYDSSSVKSVSSQFAMYLTSSGELTNKDSIESFMLFEKLYDFRFQNIGELNALIINLMQSWRRKIKDYTIARESESYKALINHPLFTNWLG